MEYKITKEAGSITCRSGTVIDGKKCNIKIILGTKEENIIKEFINSINIISTREKSFPHFFTFDRRNYMAFILSRIIKYNTEIKADGFPLNKWEIEDLKEKFGNFNDECIMFDYFGLEPIKDKFFFLENLKDKKEMSDFFIQSANRIFNLSIIASRIIDNTYSNKWGPKVIVSLEIEPIKEKMEEFKNTFQYYKDEEEDRLLHLMKNNFAFSRLLGISICKLSDKRAEIDEQRRLN